MTHVLKVTSTAIVEVMEIPGVKSFGSKLTNDGRYLFIADLGQSQIVVVDLNTKKVEMKVTSSHSPNDLAIWEDGHGGIDLYTGGSRSDSVAPGRSAILL